MIRKLVLSALITLIGAFVGLAQSGDAERYDDLSTPYFDHGSGVGITAPDSSYQMNMRFRIQNRVTYSDGDNRDESINAAIQRLRLRFSGFVADPRLQYDLQLSFAPGDFRDPDNVNLVKDAVVSYRPTDNWRVIFGQTKLPGNRQYVNSSASLQLSDRTLNSSDFAIRRDFGVQLHFLREDENRPSFNIKTAVSTGNGTNWLSQSDTDLAYTAQLELFPFGAFQRGGHYFEGDLVRERSPKLLLSGAYHYNAGAQRERGQSGSELDHKIDLMSLFLDGILKYRGFSLQAAFMMRDMDDDYGPVLVMPGAEENLYPHLGFGLDYQLSYLFRNDIELIGRYSYQQPDEDSLANVIFPKRDQVTFGITRYIRDHSVKLQSEVGTELQRYPQIHRGGQTGWYGRFQVEIGI